MFGSAEDEGIVPRMPREARAARNLPSSRDLYLDLYLWAASTESGARFTRSAPRWTQSLYELCYLRCTAAKRVG